MTHPSDDRPDPSEQPIRARVPDHVARGAFSTGVIIMTAQTELILDFIQNLGRPHQVTARIVLPHSVLPQLVDALHRNMELYKSRWGELPHLPQLPPAQTTVYGQAVPTPQPPVQSQSPTNPQSPAPSADASDGAVGGTAPSQTGQPQAGQMGASPTGVGPTGAGSGPAGVPPKANSGFQDTGTRRPSAQEIYDDLKIKDELLSGCYANAVMIGHGPHEFSFDFITNFFPHSAVSCRVFLSAGQVPRFYDSLKGTWDQMRARLNPPQPPNDSFGNDINPFS